MLSLVLTWLIVAWGALACIYLLYRAWTRFPRRDLDDVVHFLYPVDLSLAESLLDPAEDFSLRWSLSPRAYREAQRRRMRLYLELVRRMAHNSVVLVEFGNAACAGEKLEAAVVSELQQAAIKVRLYSTFARLNLRIRLLLPSGAFGVIPLPDLPRMRKVADLDGPKTYDELRTAAAAAFMQLQPGDLEGLTRNL
ncbi:MAG: hypothetical protein ABSA78_06865 [Candidatus Sulfotelmatobacter sp.]|jgi:hypothetical protein